MREHHPKRRGSRSYTQARRLCHLEGLLQLQFLLNLFIPRFHSVVADSKNTLSNKSELPQTLFHDHHCEQLFFKRLLWLLAINIHDRRES